MGDRTNGYVYADVLNASARLPVDTDGRPRILVSPIDYRDRLNLPITDQRKMDHLLWSAVCFDENGQLVIRSRRFATRTFHLLDGSFRDNPDPFSPARTRNRNIDETPDLSLLDPGLGLPLVMGGTQGDTLITTARGFVVSDFTRLRRVVNFSTPSPDPVALVNTWLLQTRENGRFRTFAEPVILNRFSGQRTIGKNLGAS